MDPVKTYLETSGLTVGYRTREGENRLLSDLTLSLREGEMICLMGPNGSGKSSLLRTLAGLQQPLGGKVRLVHSAGAPEHHLAVVLTDRVHAANLTVEEVVAFGRYPYVGWNIRLTTRDREIVANAVDRTHIRALLKRKLYELSDGQLQMVMIARALAQDTRILLLDEPTAHLDLNNRVEIMNLLKEFSRSMGKSILLATHELDLALQTADLIWLTGKDQSVLKGLPEDLVLNNAFDEIFQFKGFDLKTGKVLHQPFRGLSVHLFGEGPAYLWTKNALERSGFTVNVGNKVISVTIVQESTTLKWSVEKSGQSTDAYSIAELINLL